jgi:ribosomal protein S18 acetylase RimI-like enzyme
MDRVVMRRAGPLDAPAVRDLTRTAYAKWVEVIGREPKPMLADYDEAVRAHLIDLFYIGGDLVGLIEMVLETDHILIENVAVSPMFQRRGHGRQLIAHAEHTALSLGRPMTKLYTHGRFVENLELYRRLGYRVDREEAIADGTAVFMSKDLS